MTWPMLWLLRSSTWYPEGSGGKTDVTKIICPVSKQIKQAKKIANWKGDQCLDVATVYT